MADHNLPYENPKEPEKITKGVTAQPWCKCGEFIGPLAPVMT
jgi:hypothetical protein